MPLPIADTPWPPRALADLMPSFRRWSAWYSGDVSQLCDAYGGTNTGWRQEDLTMPAIRRDANGSRIMWGNPLPEGQIDDRVHVPLASDLCSAVSELLYSDPPQLNGTTTESQDRVNLYIEDGLFDVAAAGVEVGAALGGHYLQAVIPPDAPHAQLEVIAYDGAWPVFSRGRLISVAFWWVVASENNVTFRHFENHETDAKGVGWIRHALFEGTPDNVGARVSLAKREETRPLGTDTEVLISTGTPGLDVVHIPARSPQRVWRNHSLGRHLGRSIFQGLEGPMSALDATMTSWMRDLELGRSRLVIAEYLLENRAPGHGASFDTDRKLFTPMSFPPNIGTAGGVDPIRQVQFAIRVEEHRATAQEWVETVLRGASFSAQTFGEDENGNAMTATGVVSKDSRSMRTRRKILGPARTGLQQILRKMLAMDQAANTGPVADDQLVVAFPDGAEEQPLVVAQTAQALRVAEAASDKTLVQMVHPEWGADLVDAEVALIQEARGAGALGDPGARASVDLGGDPGDQIDTKDLSAKATAYGVLTRAGVDAATAARQVGLPGLAPQLEAAQPTGAPLPGFPGTS